MSASVGIWVDFRAVQPGTENPPMFWRDRGEIPWGRDDEHTESSTSLFNRFALGQPGM